MTSTPVSTRSSTGSHRIDRAMPVTAPEGATLRFRPHPVDDRSSAMSDCGPPSLPTAPSGDFRLVLPSPPVRDPFLPVSRAARGSASGAFVCSHRDSGRHPVSRASLFRINDVTFNLSRTVETPTAIFTPGLLAVREFRAIPARSATASLTRSKAITCPNVCNAQGCS